MYYIVYYFVYYTGYYTGYYFKSLISKTLKLLGRTKTNITMDENGENVPHLEITEVVLVHCNIVNNNYQEIYRKKYKEIYISPKEIQNIIYNWRLTH